MPYFIGDNNCVRKGTKEEPGEVVKCHDTHAEALAHLKALYVNVEDATEKLFVDVDGEWFEFVRDKGGAGSGWHRPPAGTHDAQHAPNFAGGPGKDRTYGTEQEEAPEGSKLCKCTKCGSTFTLPKGKQCRDVKCPGCGGGATQVSPHKVKPAEGESGKKEVECPDCGGEEEKQAEEKHTCTCPECGATVSVPLGQKCNEVRCPECNAMMKQGEAGKAMDAPGPTVHGEGGSLSTPARMGDTDAECKCPHCGKRVPCTAKACPYCHESIDKVERMEEEKAEWTSASMNDLPDSSFLYVESGGKKDEGGKTTPRSLRHLPYKNASGAVDLAHLRDAISRLGQPATGKGWLSEELRQRLLSRARSLLKEHGGKPEEKALTIYKSADGTWRWMTLSNWAVVDKEREVVSEGAYRDAIAHAQKHNSWGEMDLVHVDGTDVGDCDMLFIVKSGKEPAKLGAGGTWHDTAKATRAREAIQADPAYWGVSLKFRYDPAQLVRGVYTGGIEVLKHSILPQSMAASYGTAIAVQQGGKPMVKQLDEKAREALALLNLTQDEIEELAEKQKAAPTEENVVEKKEETTEPVGGLKGLWQALGKVFAPEQATVDASEPEEARKQEEVTPTTTETEPVVEKEAQETEPEATPQSDAFKALGAALAEAMKAELDKRDEQIAALTEQVKTLSVSVEEKVEARLRDVPPVVKVAPSQVAATAAPAAPGFTFGRPPAADKSTYLPELMKSIDQATKDTVGGAQYEA